MAVASAAGCAGVMLGRPALNNPSIFAAYRGCDWAGRNNNDLDHQRHVALDPPLREVVRAYAAACVQFDLAHQNAQYTLKELLTGRRVPNAFRRPHGQPAPSAERVARAASMREVAALCGVGREAYAALVRGRGGLARQAEPPARATATAAWLLASEQADYLLLLGLAASSASAQQPLAAALVNRVRLGVAAQRFAGKHPTSSAFDRSGAGPRAVRAASCPLVLSLRQEPGPPGSVHDARMLVGSVGRV